MNDNPQPERSKYAALGRWLVSRLYADATPIVCAICRRHCLHLEQKNPKLCYACDLEERIQQRGGFMRLLYDEWLVVHPWAEDASHRKAEHYFEIRIRAEALGWRFDHESFQSFMLGPLGARVRDAAKRVRGRKRSPDRS